MNPAAVHRNTARRKLPHGVAMAADLHMAQTALTAKRAKPQLAETSPLLPAVKVAPEEMHFRLRKRRRAAAEALVVMAAAPLVLVVRRRSTMNLTLRPRRTSRQIPTPALPVKGPMAEKQRTAFC